MKKKTSISVIILFLLTGSAFVHAQACCSAGVPLLGALEFPSTAAGFFTTSISWERNVLQDVLTGSEALSDASRERRTDAGLLELSYGAGRGISISVITSAVRHERNVRRTDGGTETVRTSGIGDLLALLKYSLIEMDLVDQREVSVGGGVKAPLGASTMRKDGILLPADLQPGTGAWDAILWSYLALGFVPELPVTVFGTTSFRWTGTNDRYGIGDRGYAFGNELLVSVGGSIHTDFGVDALLTLQYRHVGDDVFDTSPIPNTGGSWLNIRPGINVVSFDPVILRLSASLPVHRRLNGTQLTTSFSTMLQISYVTEL